MPAARIDKARNERPGGRVDADRLTVLLYLTDYIFLAICLAIVGGIIYAVKGASVKDSLQKQRDAMKVCVRLHSTSAGS